MNNNQKNKIKTSYGDRDFKWVRPSFALFLEKKNK